MGINYQGQGGGVPRATAKIFAENALTDDVTVFGSTLAGNTVKSKDISQIQNTAYEAGWRNAVISDKNYPLLADMNGILLAISQQVAYMLQHGLGQYDANTEYFTYDLVNQNGIIYISTQDNNTGNIPSNNSAYWAVYYDPDKKDPMRNIGEIVQSAVPLTDASLHLLDGSLLNSSGIYGAFVNYISGLVSDYPDLFVSEADWQQAVTTYGVCGKFVYDSINNTVRLPKITGIVEGTTDVTALGDLIEAGLPNITGGLESIDNEPLTFSDQLNWWGAFYAGNYHTQSGGVDLKTGSRYDGIYFNAEYANSIYGNSTTVQPQTIKVLYYIVIATTAKTDIEVDIDEIATDLNGKADTDLANIDNSGGIKIAHSASPSNTKIKDYTLGASGATYTMTADGIFNLKVMGSALGNFQVFNTSKPTSTYQVGGVVMGNGYWAGWVMPVSKGDILQIDYQTVPSAYGLTLMYATGSESEA